MAAWLRERKTNQARTRRQNRRGCNQILWGRTGGRGSCRASAALELHALWQFRLGRSLALPPFAQPRPPRIWLHPRLLTVACRQMRWTKRHPRAEMPFGDGEQDLGVHENPVWWR